MNIPARKLGQFHEILCITEGRYIRNQFPKGTMIEVCFEPGDNCRMQELLDRISIDVIEVRKDQWWRKLLRRCWIPV